MEFSFESLKLCLCFMFVYCKFYVIFILTSSKKVSPGHVFWCFGEASGAALLSLFIQIVASSCREMLWKLIHLWLCNTTTSPLVKWRKLNSVGLITWSKKTFVEIGCLYSNFWRLKLTFHYWEIYWVGFKEYKKQTALKGEQYAYSLKKKI